MRSEVFQVKRIDPKPTLTEEDLARIRGEMRKLEQTKETVNEWPEELKRNVLQEIENQIQVLQKQLA